MGTTIFSLPKAVPDKSQNDWPGHEYRLAPSINTDTPVRYHLAKMRVQFRKVRTPNETKRLVRFDKSIFHNDSFDEKMWVRLDAWWMILDRTTIGCCAFQWNKDFQEHPGKESNPTRRGSLLIESTGILPAFQGSGFGNVMKSWQIAYARYWKFKRLVTNCRKSNKAIIGLNLKFGFKKIMTVPNYYEDPLEDTVVLDLRLLVPKTR